jgi:uncharacterized membrane protein YhaH (DUF805 family)
MINPFSFQGPIGRLTYALWALPIFFAQYGVGWLAAEAQGISVRQYEAFYAFPLRMLIADQTGSGPGYASKFFSIPMTLAGLACMLLASWALVALTYRRMLANRSDGWIAAAVLVPLFQLPIILIMMLMPSWAALAEPVSESDRARKMAGWGGALQGMIAGIALTLAAVAASALVFGTYGYGIFLASPFVIGGVTAYIANRKADLDSGETNRLVMATGFFGCLALLVVALEGLGCLIMAAPLAIFAAMLGGVVGGDAGRRKRSAGGMVSSVAALPVIFALEAVFPPSLAFSTEQTITVSAAPDRVWKAIVRMETITEPVSFIHRVGIAYPVRGRVFGEGVGALRYGDFSTGTAVERVTEWEENRKLTFVVLKDIPGLRELSPYRHVHAPHVHGYFTTQETSFELIPRADGITEVVERTSHKLKLDPALYWLPFARYMVDTNNARVLRYIKAQAERSMVAGR